jgi:hypothetical protein
MAAKRGMHPPRWAYFRERRYPFSMMLEKAALDKPRAAETI